MIVLGLEGALGGFSAAVVRDGQVLAAQERQGNVALEEGLGTVRNALDAARIDRSDLSRIATGVGPGGFTGLRITLTYAKALAQAWSLPLVPVSSFDAIAFGQHAEPMLCVVEGRRGIISARYRGPGGERRASGPVAETLASILPPPGPEPLAVAGGAEDVFAFLAEAGFIVERRPSLVTPPAVAVALASESLRAAESAHAVRADYGEAPAAKVPAFRNRPAP